MFASFSNTTPTSGFGAGGTAAVAPKSSAATSGEFS